MLTTLRLATAGLLLGLSVLAPSLAYIQSPEAQPHESRPHESRPQESRPQESQPLASLAGEYRREPVQNGYHSGVLTAKQEKGAEILEWTNAAGISFNLYPTGRRDILKTGPREPYGDENHARLFIQRDGERVFGFTLADELFLRDGERPPEPPADLAIPKTDEGLPGKGTIRRYDWFRKLWLEKRSRWFRHTARDQGAVVFLGDSITQGWGDDLGGSFGPLKVANRGISGDTTRGMLLRLERDVLALHPRAVVMLMGTNDLEEGDSAREIASNVRAIVRRLVRQDPKMPILLCKVFPSSETMRRSAKDIRRVNRLCANYVERIPQVTVLDTWSIFANEDGDATRAEFPDLLHPNEQGYKKWADALRPALAKLTATPSSPAEAGAHAEGAGGGEQDGLEP
ncbi:SGNH/GDSL hydrolase family protein [Planctomycetota bacterium]|nr:SGNH/GDSL hydrolase family protein [Planctomycetota bacterium]